MSRAAIGIGSNLGNPQANVRRGIDALSSLGTVAARSRLYRTQPWGVAEQPEFCNAVAILETPLSPENLLQRLKTLEGDLGRTPGARWGPRVIDFDILLFDDARIDTPELTVPHPHLRERPFVLLPLAEVDARYRAAASNLPRDARAGVVPLDQGEGPASMPDPLVERVRSLADAFLDTDLIRLRIEDLNDDAVELRRASARPQETTASEAPPAERPAVEPVAVRSDLVGIFHFSRPAVSEGDRVDSDRELAYVEALGIRNPVRSMGAGTVVGVHARDGDPVEYGQVLFEFDRR